MQKTYLDDATRGLVVLKWSLLFMVYRIELQINCIETVKSEFCKERLNVKRNNSFKGPLGKNFGVVSREQSYLKNYGEYKEAGKFLSWQSKNCIKEILIYFEVST